MTQLPQHGRTRLATYGRIVFVTVALFAAGVLVALAFGEAPPSTPGISAEGVPATPGAP